MAENNKDYSLNVLDKILDDLSNLQEYVNTYLSSVDPQATDEIMRVLNEVDTVLCLWYKKVQIKNENE